MIFLDLTNAVITLQTAGNGCGAAGTAPSAASTGCCAFHYQGTCTTVLNQIFVCMFSINYHNTHGLTVLPQPCA